MVRLHGDCDANEGAGQKARLTIRGRRCRLDVITSRQAHPSLPDANAQSLGQHSTGTAKTALFRSLFRGREDVYPRRFESRKTGKSG